MKSPPAGHPGGHAQEELTGVDLLRVVCVAVVILLHAAAPYLTAPPKTMLWPVYDPGPHPSAVPEAFYVFARSWVTQLLFVVAGYFSVGSFARHGGQEFLRQRWKRLGIPLIVGTFTVLPVAYVVWGWGWVSKGWVNWYQVATFRYMTSDKLGLLGFGHLWFLEYLLLYSMLFAWWKQLPKKIHMRPIGSSVLTRTGGLVWMGGLVLVIGLAWLDPTMLTDFRNGFLPRPAFFVLNALYFCAGTFFHSRPQILRAMSRLGPLLVAGGAGLFAEWMWKIGPAEADLIPERILAVSGVLTTFGLLGCFLAFRFESQLISALARASFFVYVIHLPLVGAAHVLLYHRDIPVLLKWVLSGIATLVVSFALYWAWTRGLQRWKKHESRPKGCN